MTVGRGVGWHKTRIYRLTLPLCADSFRQVVAENFLAFVLMLRKIKLASFFLFPVACV